MRNKVNTTVAIKMSLQKIPAESSWLLSSCQSTSSASLAMGFRRFCKNSDAFRVACNTSHPWRCVLAATANFDRLPIRTASVNLKKFVSRSAFVESRVPYFSSNVLGSFKKRASARYGTVFTGFPRVVPSDWALEHGMSNGRYLVSVTELQYARKPPFVIVE